MIKDGIAICIQTIEDFKEDFKLGQSYKYKYDPTRKGEEFMIECSTLLSFAASANEDAFKQYFVDAQEQREDKLNLILNNILGE